MWRDRRRRWRGTNEAATLRRALLIAALCCAPALVRGEANPISPAESMLFMVPHLENLKPPARLHYSFEKSGTLEQGFSDTIDVDITGAPGGRWNATTRFFSGKRRIEYPERENVEGNPLLLFYLEREIREMSRLTGGKPSHFQHEIRSALADSAQIRDVDIRFEGRTLRAQQIMIAPYSADPSRDRFVRLATKQYTFTLSDQIPGRIYQLRGYVPPASGSDKDEAVLDETLTFESNGPLH